MNNKLNKKYLWDKIHIDPVMLIILIFLLTYSSVIVWSAIGQNIGLIKHKIIQNVIGLIIMILVAQLKPKTYEIYAPYLYILCIILLIMVDLFGSISNGAQRWLNLGIIKFQPSEIAKISVPLMVARIINRDNQLSLLNIITLIIIILLPTILIIIQPDLGTAILISLSGLFILFLSGLNWKFIGISILLLMIFVPILWFFLMHEYQRQRIIILLNPTMDPLGTGYHIIQSKIAIGSGGLFGKGLLNGTQSQLEFLPERHTDFIFAVLAEELGLMGIIVLLILYLLLIIRGLWIATITKSTFGRIISAELMLILFVYIFLNIGMVSGLLPVVGVPLPIISYGGSALIMLMVGFGIIMSIHTHKKMLSNKL